MSTWDINAFFTRINKFGEQKFKIDKGIQCLLKVTTRVVTSIEYKKYMVSTNVE